MYDFTHQWQMEVLANNSVADEYEVNDSIFVEGRKGSQLKLKLTNSSDDECMFIPSLDGLSVYDEQPANLNSRGVVLAPLSSSIVNIWAVSNEPLEFVGNKSFDKRTGKGTDNVGVVGCIVFRKRMWESIAHPTIEDCYRSNFDSSDVVYTSSATAASATADNLMLSNNYANVVTNWPGYQSAYDDVFVKRDASYPDGVMTIYYDSARGLEKRGIQLKYKTPHTPDPFPVAKGMRRR